MTSPLPGIFAPLTVPASWIYGAVLAGRNARFDRGERVESIALPAISVGNLTVGGAGKTPTVAWIADLLAGHGRRPVIAMRGYGARPPEPGDEEAEYARRLPDVPVVANPDRVTALRAFLREHPEVDCVLLDDGFQHRRIARDLDLVLVDATRGTFSDRLLPLGLLREPLANLRRADAVIVTRARRLDDTLAAQIEHHHGRPPVAWSRHIWTGLDVYAPEPRREPVEWLRHKRVLTMLGVGHPASVIDQLKELGAHVEADIPARDHERFSRSKVELARRMCEGLDAMVVTGKDMARMQSRLDLEKRPVVVVPRLAIDVFSGREQLEKLILGSLES